MFTITNDIIPSADINKDNNNLENSIMADIELLYTARLNSNYLIMDIKALHRSFWCLIDSGATVNFISTTVVKEHNL